MSCENFTFCAPTKIVFGRGVNKEVGKTVKQDGFSKVLLAMGEGSVGIRLLLILVMTCIDSAQWCL